MSFKDSAAFFFDMPNAYIRAVFAKLSNGCDPDHCLCSSALQAHLSVFSHTRVYQT
jgi:hypothetical protein